MKTYFIADISANHDGDIERAKQLCTLAKAAGADAAKFQHFKAETIVSDQGFKRLGDDNNRVGPDHPFSMNPVTWKQMVDRTRRLELALGSPIKKVEDNEKETVVLQRRSIRLKEKLKPGHTITKDDIYYVRPCPDDALPIHINPVGRMYDAYLDANDYLRVYDIK
ncbi:N,N'-diacetyllegionaminic acid synthase-like [Sycon ciliatum]|uniref:N,N'-diacetyllegionaminic acid synthase-like n=1 Tax=Sycon ciliatum TaxID=27933 RepID=UPI0031F70E41